VAAWHATSLVSSLESIIIHFVANRIRCALLSFPISQFHIHICNKYWRLRKSYPIPWAAYWFSIPVGWSISIYMAGGFGSPSRSRQPKTSECDCQLGKVEQWLAKYLGWICTRSGVIERTVRRQPNPSGSGSVQCRQVQGRIALPHASAVQSTASLGVGRWACTARLPC